MSAIRRDHKQTNIKMGKKLSNFLDITSAKNTERQNTKKQSRDYVYYQETPQTNLYKHGQKLSNFLDIKSAQNYRKIQKYQKAKQRLWLLSGETTLPRLSLLLTITSTRVVHQSSN